MAIPGIPLIKSGWQTFKGHFLFVWAILGITIGISIFFNLLENRLMRATDEFLPYALFTILSFLVMLWIQLGATSIFIHLARTGEELTIDRLFSQKEIFWRALLASVAYYALVIVGFLLLIIPGIYLALRYYFLLFVIIDEKPETVGEAFKRAGALTKGKVWPLFVFMLLLILLNIAGFVALFVGLLVTVPVATLALVHCYLSLLPKKDVETGSVSEEAQADKPPVAAPAPVPEA